MRPISERKKNIISIDLVILRPVGMDNFLFVLSFLEGNTRLGWIAFSLANLLIEPNIRSEQIVFILCLKCALGEVVG